MGLLPKGQSKNYLLGFGNQLMAAMKPRTGNGPMEAVIESRKIVMRIPTDGGGRLVIELNKEEAAELGSLLTAVAEQ